MLNLRERLPCHHLPQKATATGTVLAEVQKTQWENYEPDYCPLSHIYTGTKYRALATEKEAIETLAVPTSFWVLFCAYKHELHTDGSLNGIGFQLYYDEVIGAFEKGRLRRHRSGRSDAAQATVKRENHCSCQPGSRRRPGARYSHATQLVSIPVAFKQRYLLVSDIQLTTNDTRSYVVYGQRPEG